MNSLIVPGVLLALALLKGQAASASPVSGSTATTLPSSNQPNSAGIPGTVALTQPAVGVLFKPTGGVSYPGGPAPTGGVSYPGGPAPTGGVSYPGGPAPTAIPAPLGGPTIAPITTGLAHGGSGGVYRGGVATLYKAQ